MWPGLRLVLNYKYLTVQNKTLVNGDIYTALKGNVYEITLYYRLPSINKDYLFVLVLCQRHIESMTEILSTRDTYNDSSTKNNVGALQIILD